MAFQYHIHDDRKTPFTRAKVLYVLILTLLLCSSPIITAQNTSTFTVVLDAGHGGRDPGCLGSQSKEKDLALDVTLLAGNKLRALYPQINILYTRKTDVFVPLKERARIANEAQADLFLSIHCNFAPNKPHVVGTETFVMGLHKQASNLEVVKRENGVINMEDDVDHYKDLDPNSPIGHILLQSRQDANLEESIEVASNIQNEFTHTLSRNNRGVKQAGFLVLYQTTMPSALIEVGFLSNKKEEAYCMSDEGQNDLSNAICRAVGKYIQSNSPSTQPVFTSTKSKPTEQTTDLPITYKIQIAASKNEPLEIDQDGPWSNIEDYEIVAEAGLYKYITGNFLSLLEASAKKDVLRKAGFKGAFVVAYRGVKRVKITP